MRSWGAILACLAALLTSAPLWAASHVQSSTAVFVGTDTAVVSLTGVGSGNALAVCIGTSGDNTTFTIADDQSNVYVEKHETTAEGSFAMGMAYALATASGNTQITVTASGNVFGFVIVHEFSGADTFVDSAANSQSAPGTGTDAVTSTAITTTGTDVYVFGCTLNATFTAEDTASGTGFTEATDTNDNGVRGTAEYLIQGSGGSIAATFTASADTGHATGIMAFNEAAAAAECNPVVRFLTLGIAGC